MLTNLTEKEKMVFAWIAERNRKGEVGPCSFAPVMKDLGIAEEELYTILEKLRNYPFFFGVVKSIHRTGLVDVPYFEIMPEAHKDWDEYQQAEREAIQPD